MNKWLSFITAGCLLLGCASTDQDEFTAINAGHILFESNALNNAEINCQFDLELVYYHNQPINLVLHTQLKNESDGPLQLNSDKDRLTLVVSEKYSYPVKLSDGKGYEGSIAPSETYHESFPVYSESLFRYAKMRKIREIQYQFNSDQYHCRASQSSQRKSAFE